MHVCFFTKPNMAVFIFRFIVIAYILPSVFILPLTLFFCKVKTKISATSCLSLVHSYALTVWHMFSVIGLFYF